MPPSIQQRITECGEPHQPVVMYQHWQNLLFLHWRVEPTEIQKTLPEGLFVDTFDDSAWLAIVPFQMRRIRPRFCPSVPGISDFLELNLRTYVFDKQGRPGVWFYTLDCNQPLAVWIARTLFQLPYQHSKMAFSESGDSTFDYRSHRVGHPEASRFEYQLGQTHEVAVPGTLEHFLLERYRLFASSRRGLLTGRVHHSPYPMAQANVSQWDSTLFSQNGFAQPTRPPDHIIGTPGVSVKVYPMEKVPH